MRSDVGWQRSRWQSLCPLRDEFDEALRFEGVHDVRHAGGRGVFELLAGCRNQLLYFLHLEIGDGSDEDIGRGIDLTLTMQEEYRHFDVTQHLIVAATLGHGPFAEGAPPTRGRIP